MIIELFGAPGAGKTTFARALATRLRGNGQTVDLMLSYRPAEISPATDLQDHQISSVLRRLTRPSAEMLTMARHPVTFSRHLSSALDLIKTMPPADILWRLRLAQYLSRLSRAWSLASKAEHIVLFDQAFVQAVCSLAVLCGAANQPMISRTFDKIPESHLLVLLEAPTRVLEARLCERQKLASRMERMLEMDLATSLRSAAVIDCLLQLIQSKGRRVAIVTSLDRHSLKDSLERIEGQVAAQFNNRRRAATGENLADIDFLSADRQLAIPVQPLVDES